MLIRRHQEVYGKTIKMNQLSIIVKFYFSSNYNNSVLFKFKQQITGQTGNGGAKDVEIIVRLKYPSNF